MYKRQVWFIFLRSRPKTSSSTLKDARVRAASHSRGNHQRKGRFVKNVIFAVLRVRRGIFFPPFTGTFSFQNETLSYVSPPRKCAPLSISNTNLYSQCVWPSLGKTFENNTSCYERQSLFVHSGCSLWPLFIFESSRHEEKSSHFWRLLQGTFNCCKLF